MNNIAVFQGISVWIIELNRLERELELLYIGSLIKACIRWYYWVTGFCVYA